MSSKLNKIKCFFFGHIPKEEVAEDVLIGHGYNISGQLSMSSKSPVDYSYKTTKTTICKRCHKTLNWRVIDRK